MLIIIIILMVLQCKDVPVVLQQKASSLVLCLTAERSFPHLHRAVRAVLSRWLSLFPTVRDDKLGGEGGSSFSALIAKPSLDRCVTHFTASDIVSSPEYVRKSRMSRLNKTTSSLVRAPDLTPEKKGSDKATALGSFNLWVSCVHRRTYVLGHKRLE